MLTHFSHNKYTQHSHTHTHALTVTLLPQNIYRCSIRTPANCTTSEDSSHRAQMKRKAISQTIPGQARPGQTNPQSRSPSPSPQKQLTGSPEPLAETWPTPSRQTTPDPLPRTALSGWLAGKSQLMNTFELVNFSPPTPVAQCHSFGVGFYFWPEVSLALHVHNYEFIKRNALGSV